MDGMEIKLICISIALIVMFAGCGEDNYSDNSSEPPAMIEPEIISVSDCSQMKNPGAYQQDVFCSSAYQYYQELQEMLQNLAGNSADVTGTFVYFQHIAPEEMYAGIDYDQTQISCDSPDIRQIEIDEKGNNIYADNYPNNHFQNGLGEPLCQFLAYIGSIEQTQEWKYSKKPIHYFDEIIQNSINFGPTERNFPNVFDTLVINLSADGKDHYIQEGGQVTSMYMPNGESIPFTAEYFQENKENNYSAYWGMSAGGGSGAGFQVYIGDDPSPDNVIFCGGFGGGGGFTSPEFDVDSEGNISNILQLYIGSGGGGGLQFSAHKDYPQFTDGLGLGAGAGTGPQVPSVVHPQYSYYPDSSRPKFNLWNEEVINQFSSEISSLKDVISSTPISVVGGGGMGVGAEYMYLDSTQTQLNEYTPHVISTGGGFTFAFTIEPSNTSKSLKPRISPQQLLTKVDTNFYENYGQYYNTATKLAYQNTKGKGGYACSLYICKYSQAYIRQKAVDFFGDEKKIPRSLNIDNCNFGDYDADPKICPIYDGGSNL